MKDHQKSCPLVKIRSVILSFQEKHLQLQNQLESTQKELKSTQITLQNEMTAHKDTRTQLQSLQNGLFNQQFSKSTDGTIKPGDLKYKVGSDNIAFTNSIPNLNFVFSIKFKIISIGDGPWNMIGIASDQSFNIGWLQSTHYVGWCFGGNNHFIYIKIIYFNFSLKIECKEGSLSRT